MGVGLGVGEVVEGHDLHIPVEAVLFIDGAEGEAADATETVDADANGHGESPGAGREGAGRRRDVAASRPPVGDGIYIAVQGPLNRPPEFGGFDYS